MREYWIVNPKTKSILVYRLKDKNEYTEQEKFSFDNNIKVGIFNDLTINLVKTLV